MAKPGMPAWKPTKKHLTTIKKAAEVGQTEGNIATLVGVSRSTFYELKKRHPVIQDILDTAYATSESIYANVVDASAKGGNVKDCQWMLARRHGWSDRSVIAVDEPNDEETKFNFSKIKKQTGDDDDE